MLASELSKKLQEVVQEYGDVPILYDTASGRDMGCASIDSVTVMLAGNGVPWGMNVGQTFVLLRMDR